MENGDHDQHYSVDNQNYKAARGLWFLWHQPESGRHESQLAGYADDPVVSRVADAIRRGPAGLAEVARSGDAVAVDLLDIVAGLPAPRLIPLKRPDSSAGEQQELADELFDKVAHAIDESGPGSGHWPKGPQHTCAAKEEVGAAIFICPNETVAARMYTPTWHTCPACMHKRVKRMSKQVLVTSDKAGPMTWAYLDGEKHDGEKRSEFQRWAGNIRQHRHRTGEEVHYRAIPQADGRMFVMSTAGLAGKPVPTDRRELYDLIHPHANTPEGQRASSSQGFGGDYRRLRGEGRPDRKGVRLWTDARLEHVGRALGVTVREGQSAFRVTIDGYEAFQRLAAAEIGMRARKGQGQAVKVLAEGLAEDVTHKAYSSGGEEELYLMRDTKEPSPSLYHAAPLQNALLGVPL